MFAVFVVFRCAVLCCAVLCRVWRTQIGRKPADAVGAPEIMGLHRRLRDAGARRYRHPGPLAVLRTPLRLVREYIQQHEYTWKYDVYLHL